MKKDIVHDVITDSIKKKKRVHTIYRDTLKQTAHNAQYKEYGHLDNSLGSSLRDQFQKKFNSIQDGIKNLKELEECTFHPSINSNTAMDQSVNSFGNITSSVLNNHNISYISSVLTPTPKCPNQKKLNKWNGPQNFGGNDKKCLEKEKKELNHYKSNGTFIEHHIEGMDADDSHTGTMMKRLHRFCKKFKTQIITKHPSFVKTNIGACHNNNDKSILKAESGNYMSENRSLTNDYQEEDFLHLKKKASNNGNTTRHKYNNSCYINNPVIKQQTNSNNLLDIPQSTSQFFDNSNDTPMRKRHKTPLSTNKNKAKSKRAKSPI